jgi:phosphopantothenoylcysteine decarboxylase/phosphopantothenate--cysteine ligase
VGSAAETGDLKARAAAKMKAKNVDLMVANDVRAKDAGFEADENRVTFLWPDGRTTTPPRGTKRAIGSLVWDEVEALLAETR